MVGAGRWAAIAGCARRLCVNGASVARGKATSDETIELIKATYAMNGNARETARVLGVPEATVRKHIAPDVKDEFAQVRAEKRVDIIAKAAGVQIALLDAMIDPDALKKASLQEKATAFGIVTDKIQLMSGEATERHEHRNTTEARDTLARRVDELAERRRARDGAGDAVGARRA